MKFTFEGSAGAFNAATMEEVLLRQVQSTGKRNAVICLLCIVFLLIGAVSLAAGAGAKRAALFAVIALLLFLYLRRSSAVAAGRSQETILQLLKADNALSEEERERVFLYTFEGNACTMSSGGKVLGVWEWKELKSADESDNVIALRRMDSEAHQSVLPVPKNCLKDATLDAFRDYLSAQLSEKKKVTYYKIPTYLRDLLD